MIHMDEPESVAAYLKSKRLSPDSKRLFLKIIGDLRARNLPVVMFETGRKDSAQRLIDENPVLRELQKEWRKVFVRRREDASDLWNKPAFTICTNRAILSIRCIIFGRYAGTNFGASLPRNSPARKFSAVTRLQYATGI